MSFSVYFANSSKPENSTHAFSTTGMTYYDCVLKKGTSVSNPVIELQVSYTDFANLAKTANVAYIGALERYYFVTDWRYDGRLAICSLSVDVLASFWDKLKLQSYYVTRSAYLSNKYVVDTEYPAIASQRSQYVTQVSNPFQPVATDYGCFVVGVVNKYGGLDGCVTYYCMGYLVFMNFMSKVFTIGSYGTTGTNTDTLSQDLAEAITRPMQYIASIMWYPFSTSTLNALGFLSSTSTIYYGYSSLSITGTLYEFDNSVLHKNVCNMITFTITHHPDHNNANSFLNLAPYGEYRFSFYPFGTFNIDGKYLQGFSNMYCLYNVDLRTGRGTMQLATSYTGTTYADWKLPASFLCAEAQVGVPIPTSTVETLLPDMPLLEKTALVGVSTGSFAGFGETVKQAFQTIGNSVGGIAGGTIGAEIGKTVGNAINTAIDTVGTLADEVGAYIDNSGIGSAMQQALASPTMGGSQGAISLYPKMDVAFSCWFMSRTGLDTTHKGEPLCQVVQLSTLQGYTVCSSAVANITGPNYAEKRKIENFLNTGFYIAV